ncbi:MAG TPA: macro domain-containing protein, partial [Longimicrobiales bacterium]|nr:macro domain-containing protein [Longimicrobiales bacterium]
LRLAEEHQLRSVAFPAISTGAFGYPAEPAAEAALRTVAEEAQRLESVERIRFVLYDAHALDVHARALERIASELQGGPEP